MTLTLRLFFSLLVSTALPSMLMGQSFDESEEMSFFDINDSSGDDNFFEIGDDREEEPVLEASYFVTGSLRQGFTYGIASPSDSFNRDKRGIEKINSELFLKAEGKPANSLKIKFSALLDYDWGGWRNSAYSLGGLDANFEVKDLFLDFTTDRGVWVRFGNQIIARGAVDSVKATDLINPVDLSAPGQAELKDLRIQVPALLVSVPLGGAGVELIVTNDAGSDKFGSTLPGSAFDFSILNAQIVNFLPEGSGLIVEDNDLKESWEVVSRANFKLNGGDISVIAGKINWNQSSLHAVKESMPLIMEYGFDRVTVVGLSGNLARDNYLFKYEAALNNGRRFQNLNPISAWTEHKEGILALGIEYNGFGDTVLSAEINNSNIFNHSTNLSSEENEMGYLLQARWSGFNDLLSLYGSFNKLTGDDSSITTFFVEYELTDNLQLDGRVITYDSKSPTDLFYTFKEQDVVKASVKYSF